MEVKNMFNPKISVIVPVYNTSQYLEEALMSVLNQTIVDDIEVLMIDDGSCDDSRYIIERFALDYENFHAFHKSNEGQGIARNFGLDMAKGKFIHFLDSDDYVAPDAYEKMYELAESGNYDFVVGDVLRFGLYNNWQDQLFKHAFKGLDGDVAFKTIDEHPDFVWDSLVTSKLFRKEFLKRNNIDFLNKKIFFEDVLFSFESYVKSSNFCYLDHVVYHWRLRSENSSVTQQLNSMINFKDRLEIIGHLIDLIKSNNLSDLVKNRIYEKWLLHDLKIYINRINEMYTEEFQNKVLAILSDIPSDIVLNISTRNIRFKHYLIFL